VDLFDRIFRAHSLLRSARVPVSHRTLEEKLECSRATVTRIIKEMRLYLNAPIEYDRRINGYRYAAQADGPYELPGLWFNASELHALLVAQQLLSEAQPGLIEEHLAPLRDRIEKILSSRRLAKGNIADRIRILRMNSRRMEPEHFRTVAGALLQGRRLQLTYHGRGSNSVTEREVSPQRIVHYRDNWYLDAFDHGKNDLRSFSVDRIRKADVLDKNAKDIPAKTLNEHYTAAYGIFAGKPTNRAVLRFSPERARWVADEMWHPEQVGKYEGEHYILEIPYSDPRELMLDILRYGDSVEVLAPPELRREVRQHLVRALDQYPA
jgi:predicted DNA-binding transcriptional regulator YafY